MRRLYSYDEDMKISGASLGSWTRCVLIGVVVVWIFVLILISNGVWRQDLTGELPELSAQSAHFAQLKNQLADVLSELHTLKNENSRLKTLWAQQDRGPLPPLAAPAPGRQDAFHPRNLVSGGEKTHENQPVANGATHEIVENGGESIELYSKDHEVSRRLLSNVIQETFFYVKSYVETPGNWKRKQAFDTFKTGIMDQMRWMLAATQNFGENVDSAGEWHRRSLEKLTAGVQQTIHNLQNPKNCSEAKYLTCELNKGCGFGCQLHHVTYCLLVAAASNRTMILDRDGEEWRYSDNGWKSVFKPISSCPAKFTQGTGSEEPFTSISQSARVVHLPIVDVLGVKVDQLPQSFPKQLEADLLTHHSNPSVFFIAQFLWYLMRENQQMTEIVSKAAQNIPFDKGLVVGLQIRRTDKVGTEAAFHSVDEYMEWTELWFRVQEARNGQKPIPRRVFVATDDPAAVKELKEKYTNYEVFFNDGSAQTAQLSNRYSDASLYGIITDIRMLSKCDYLVCTFSSQVCRMGYELMQVVHGDVAERYHSLDDIYYYGGQLAHNMIATGPYHSNTTGEIDLQDGDILGIAGNHWNGFSRGLNRRTGHSGLFPSYLTREEWRVVDFPIFNRR